MSESARKTTGIIRVREKSKPHDISELKPISYWISKNSPGVDVSKIKKIVWTKTKISEYNYEYNFIIFLIDGNAIFFSVTKTYTDDVEFIDYHNNNVDIFEPLYTISGSIEFAFLIARPLLNEIECVKLTVSAI